MIFVILNIYENYKATSKQCADDMQPTSTRFGHKRVMAQ